MIVPGNSAGKVVFMYTTSRGIDLSVEMQPPRHNLVSLPERDSLFDYYPYSRKDIFGSIYLLRNPTFDLDFQYSGEDLGWVTSP